MKAAAPKATKTSTSEGEGSEDSYEDNRPERDEGDEEVKRPKAMDDGVGICVWRFLGLQFGSGRDCSRGAIAHFN